jgi:uncharacterized RDD family membrane protein YckC
MTQTPHTPAAPGWYDDPQDATLLRYFDGIVWTANTTPRRSPTADASVIGRALPGSGGPAARSTGWGQSRQQGRGAWPQQPGQPGQPGQQGEPGQPGQPGQWPGPGMPPTSQGPYGPGWATPRRDVLPDGAVLAEWWRRLLGRVLDIVVTTVTTVILAFPWLRDAASTMSDFFARTVQAAEAGGTPPDQAALMEQALQVALPVTLIGIVVSLVYEVAFLTTRGATPGKMVVGTFVRRVGSSGRLSVVDVLKRQAIAVSTALLGLVPLVSVFASGLRLLDPAWLLWDPKRQALHDKVADTVVVLRNPQR